MGGCRCGSTAMITVWRVTAPDGDVKDFHREDKARAYVEEVTGTLEAIRVGPS